MSKSSTCENDIVELQVPQNCKRFRSFVSKEPTRYAQAQDTWQTKHSICCNLIILVIYKYIIRTRRELKLIGYFLKTPTNQTNKTTQQGSDALPGTDTTPSAFTVTPIQAVAWHNVENTWQFALRHDHDTHSMRN